MCSVLFAELVGYAHLPASEQLRRKRQLKAQVAQEVVQVPMALASAIGLQAGAASEQRRVGLSLGTVDVVTDLNGQTALDVLTGEIELDGAMWTAVCDAGGAGG